jgi:hypothetical protein
VAEISNQQIFDLPVEILLDVAELDASVDDLLLDMKAFNQELSAGREGLMQQVRPT